jgi:hypothetical protein
MTPTLVALLDRAASAPAALQAEQVTVLISNEGGAAGCVTRFGLTERTIGAAPIAAAHKAGADLLAMGPLTPSRFPEFVFVRGDARDPGGCGSAVADAASTCVLLERLELWRDRS